jgi:hypothetical protein
MTIINNEFSSVFKMILNGFGSKLGYPIWDKVELILKKLHL